MGGGGSDNDQTQTSIPWSGVQPHIKRYLSAAGSEQQKPFDFNSGTQVAGFSPETELALSQMTNRAITGSPVLNSAQMNAFNTLEGNYMSPDSNPYLRQNVDTAMGAVQSRVNSQFNNSNFGGSAHQEMLTRNLADTAAGMYGQNYNNERQNQLTFSQYAPQLAESDYRDARALLGVGDSRQQLAQQYLDQANGLWNANNNYAQTQLDNYGRAISLGMGGGGTTTISGGSGGGSNPMAGALGGAAAGASVAGPWGALAGAVLGGISS